MSDVPTSCAEHRRTSFPPRIPAFSQLGTRISKWPSNIPALSLKPGHSDSAPVPKRTGLSGVGLSMEDFLDGLLSKEAEDQPSDNVPLEKLEMKLPDDFDEKRFNQGRRFYWDNCYAMSTSMMLGLVAVFAVPSILRILVSTRRSNSTFTAYRRYLSTLLHTVTWFEHELKPGTKSWKSLYAVRTRHLKAGNAAKLKGLGVVSQRDIALTQYGFIGFSLLKPDKFGITQLQEGDWEAYVYSWRVIGQMIGLEDRYNICRKTAEETRQVCQALQDRVYTPCLENVPEYYEHAARVMLDAEWFAHWFQGVAISGFDSRSGQHKKNNFLYCVGSGMWSVNPTVNVSAMLYLTRYLADVPGYVYTETDRIQFQRKLRKQLQGKSSDTGVDSTSLMSKPALSGLPSLPPRLHYMRDYEKLETVPNYKQLCLKAKYKIAFFTIQFGVKKSLVDIFVEDPIDDAKLIPNSEYYKKDMVEEPWHKKCLSFIW
ncbi:unnamed protein product [Diatraea saccharalis]|uniref:ER-bound oxygenase mpaB/mpaB'/Rubber oxygenase catalytic domain-containing protein n=1 Tax=Diatraea saccharalis TaxID=40085 RepID=A0A9N9WGZ2_9NEOP|nr:unnamed protein product [Diatraea saccharalis]